MYYLRSLRKIVALRWLLLHQNIKISDDLQTRWLIFIIQKINFIASTDSRGHFN